MDFSNPGTGIPLNRGQLRWLVFGGAVQAVFFLKLEFERGNAETEASETDHCERPTIDPEADIYEQGLSVRAISERLQISKTSVAIYLLRAREAGLSWPLPPV